MQGKVTGDYMNHGTRDLEKTIKHRVITLLDRRELDFLDKLAKDALFSTVHKLSYNEILRSLIDFMIEIGLSAQGVDCEKAFRERILEQVLAISKNEVIKHDKSCIAKAKEV
jgi:hypothetical protein